MWKKILPLTVALPIVGLFRMGWITMNPNIEQHINEIFAGIFLQSGWTALIVFVINPH